MFTLYDPKVKGPLLARVCRYMKRAVLDPIKQQQQQHLDDSTAMSGSKGGSETPVGENYPALGAPVAPPPPAAATAKGSPGRAPEPMEGDVNLAERSMELRHCRLRYCIQIISGTGVNKCGLWDWQV